MLDGEDLAERVGAATKNAPVRLGIDCIGGKATDRIASCLELGATLVVYGAMSGGLTAIAPGTIVFKDLRVRGSTLSKSASKHPSPTRSTSSIVRFGRTFRQWQLGRTKSPPSFGLPISGDAVRRASQSGIDGKVIVTFN